ncbi:MAG: class I SAM-dependent methyltransferase [bacterium]
MSEESKLKKQWEKTQSAWDDTDFLLNRANAFMKKRWAKLNNNIVDIVGKEVVAKNEYINLLDIGAGRGDFYKNIQNLVKKYTGIEPSEKMLKNEIFEEDFILKRGKGEDLADEQMYDVVLIKEVLDHCYAPEKVIGNAFRALKQGGIIIISLTNKDAYYKKLFKTYAAKLVDTHKDHLYNFNPKEILELLQTAGFTLEKTMATNYLRLPFIVENLVGKLPQGIVFGILDFTDRVGNVFMKNEGGSFIITARKNSF